MHVCLLSSSTNLSVPRQHQRILDENVQIRNHRRCLPSISLPKEIEGEDNLPPLLPNIPPRAEHYWVYWGIRKVLVSKRPDGSARPEIVGPPVDEAVVSWGS